jgi:hypothetical protein
MLAAEFNTTLLSSMHQMPAGDVAENMRLRG